MLATKLARLAALSIVTLAGLTAAASAAGIAYTTTASNLRDGPGTLYSVITTLPKNSAVSVDACTATWCAVVTEDDDEGFIARSLLKANPSGAERPFSISITIAPEGRFLKFGNSFGSGGPGPRPSPRVDPEVCFYQQADFRGANFCVGDGDAEKRIPGSFNDNIESILITGGLGVEACSGVNHGGECQYFTRSQRSLPGYLRNKISSYQVDDGASGFSGNYDDYDDDAGVGFITLQ